MAGAVDLVGVGGKALGSGIGLWGALRFIRWMVEFICKRQDIRSGQLDDRERNLEARFNSRLAHVETELKSYRMATLRLLTRIGEIMPHDPVLLEVANILREAIPMDDINEDLERLMRQAKRSGE